MIERQIEAPVLPGDDDGQLPIVGEATAGPKGLSDESMHGDPYIEPGGLVDIAVHELGGEVTEVELLPDADR